MKTYGDIETGGQGKFKNLTIDNGDEFPPASEGELFYVNGTAHGHSVGLHYYDGTAWILIVNNAALNTAVARTTGISENNGNRGFSSRVKGIAPVDSDDLATKDYIDSLVAAIPVAPSGDPSAVSKSGDSMTGSLSLPKTQGMGLLVDNGYGWRDIVGDITPRPTTSYAPTLKTLVDDISYYTYMAADRGDITFHMPHDYAPGTDMFIHVHWTHNGTDISGSFVVNFAITYAKGHQQAIFNTPVTPTLTATSLNLINTPNLSHRIDEIQLSTPGGSATNLDTNLLEVDGLILVNYTVGTIPIISGSPHSNAPYLMTIDLHYQSTGMATKNKAPNFYG